MSGGENWFGERATRILRALRSNVRGATMPMMVAGLIPVIGAIGSAIDIGRLYIVRAQMQTGVDAAALAGARAFGTDDNSAADRDTQVSVYFGENFPASYLGAGTVNLTPTFRTDRGINITSVTATTQLPMIFMQLFGFGAREITATATAELQPKPIEVMVVLDDTGSMQTQDVGGGTRMAALKAAMLNFNNILHQGAATRAELAMGFVTYNVTTNVGKILTDHGVTIQAVDGFTNVADYTGGSNGSANPLGWRGCVDNDQSIRDLTTGVNPELPADYPDGAWDVTKTLPGETRNGLVHPAIRPYHYMPVAELNTPADTYATSINAVSKFAPQHTQSNTTDGRTNNHYLLGPTTDLSETSQGSRLANSDAYRQSFYNFYIGLNTGTADVNDDVIVRASDGGYHTPGAATAWKVNYARVPRITDATSWANPNTNYGYPLNTASRNGATLRMPTPNWQCPEPAMMISYGRQKTEYDDYINFENFPVMPASGTLHHIGFLWGYRILTRSDVFTRTNPVPSETPLRALVFMTDGLTEVNTGRRIWSGAYGRMAEQRIAADSGQFANQIMNRFAKICELAKRDGIAVYIVSLKASPSQFSQCAGSRYYYTTNAATINSAFEQIAVDLVDLHLTQ